MSTGVRGRMGSPCRSFSSASSGALMRLVHDARGSSRAHRRSSRVRTACAPCASSDFFLVTASSTRWRRGDSASSRMRKVRLDRGFSSCARLWMSSRCVDALRPRLGRMRKHDCLSSSVGVPAGPATTWCGYMTLLTSCGRTSMRSGSQAIWQGGMPHIESDLGLCAHMKVSKSNRSERKLA
ncbi:hypothetical protein FA95DRAFT_831445 [Auriscalpium vulgare]|uniref:Uncharacterized protein n=1 Tax=Auriscalpium vulgare TaxID=40419 RepID=A0ACB8R9R7_9AGAM|nr:hypothetical protein FA95DRAFT_831445 [Auriscalpium vulgare]